MQIYRDLIEYISGHVSDNTFQICLFSKLHIVTVLKMKKHIAGKFNSRFVRAFRLLLTEFASIFITKEIHRAVVSANT